MIFGNFNRRIKDNSRNLITLYDELTRHIETDTKLASIVSKLQDEIEILKKEIKVENGKTLCKKCHIETHRGKRR